MACGQAKPAQNCSPSHTSSIQLSWFFKASWISPWKPENHHERSNNFQTSPEIISNLPIFVGVSEGLNSPTSWGAIYLGQGRSTQLLPKAPMSKRIVEISAVIVACGCWELYPKMGRPQSIGSDESMSLQELYLKLIISEKNWTTSKIHTGFTVSISSNTLGTHECNTTVRSSTRWRLVMMEWVASTRARISSKSTFTASIAAVKSCPQQWSLVAIPHIRKGANCTKTATKPRDWWQSGFSQCKNKMLLDQFNQPHMSTLQQRQTNSKTPPCHAHRPVQCDGCGLLHLCCLSQGWSDGNVCNLSSPYLKSAFLSQGMSWANAADYLKALHIYIQYMSSLQEMLWEQKQFCNMCSAEFPSCTHLSPAWSSRSILIHLVSRKPDTKVV